MATLNWSIGTVQDRNDALITGAIQDVASVTTRGASSVLNTVSPSALAVFDNTTTLIRKPFTTLGTAENYWKLARTVPAIPMDLIMKAIRLPFSRIDDALNYVVNNNLDRGLEAVKSVTTWLAANLITNNGHTRFKVLRAIGTAIEWAGDLVGTLIKTPTWALAAGTWFLDTLLAKWTQWTEGFVNSVRISDKNFVNSNPIVPTADMPAVANNNRPPLTHANNNSTWAAVAA